MHVSSTSLTIVFSSEKMKNIFKEKAVSKDRSMDFSLESVMPAPKGVSAYRYYGWIERNWGSCEDFIKSVLISEDWNSLEYRLDTKSHSPTNMIYTLFKKYNYIQRLFLNYYSPSYGVAGEMVLDSRTSHHYSYDRQFQKNEYIKYAEMFGDLVEIEELTSL